MKTSFRQKFIGTALLATLPFASCISAGARGGKKNADPGPVVQLATQQADAAIAALKQSGSLTPLDEERIRDDAKLFADAEAAGTKAQAGIQKDCYFGNTFPDVKIVKNAQGHEVPDIKVGAVLPGTEMWRDIGSLQFKTVKMFVGNENSDSECKAIAQRIQDAINYFNGGPLPANAGQAAAYTTAAFHPAFK